MKENIILLKTFDFALRIVKLNKFLIEEKKEFVISKQILRSGTSIGANIEETVGGLSEKEFIHKLSITYREARETHYWLRLLLGGENISQSQFDSLINDCDEILRIIGSIQKTMRKKTQK